MPELQADFAASRVEKALEDTLVFCNCTKNEDEFFEVLSLVKENLSRFPGDVFEIVLMDVQEKKTLSADLVSVFQALAFSDPVFPGYSAQRSMEICEKLSESPVFLYQRASLYIKAMLVEEVSPREAISVYESLLSLKNKNSRFQGLNFLSLCALYARIGELDKALQLYEEGLTLYGHLSLEKEGDFFSAYFLHAMASVYYEKKQYEKTLSVLERIRLEFSSYQAMETVIQDIETVRKNLGGK